MSSKNKLVSIVAIIFAMLAIIFTINIFSIKEVSTNQYEEELLGRVQFCVPMQYTNESSYELRKCEITKRQTNKDSKEDKIFCVAEIENNYFRVELETSMYYTYYDEGGWILEEFSYSLISAIPLKPAEADLIIEEVLANSTIDSSSSQTINAVRDDSDKSQLKFGNLEKDGDVIFEKNSEEITVPVRYKSSILNAKGIITANFNMYDGWNLVDFALDSTKPAFVLIETFTSDVSKINGTYYGYNEGTLRNDFKIVINEFNDDCTRAECVYYIDYKKFDGYLDFNPLTGSGKFGGLLTGLTVQYNPIVGEFFFTSGAKFLMYDLNGGLIKLPETLKKQ